MHYLPTNLPIAFSSRWLGASFCFFMLLLGTLPAKATPIQNVQGVLDSGSVCKGATIGFETGNTLISILNGAVYDIDLSLTNPKVKTFDTVGSHLIVRVDTINGNDTMLIVVVDDPVAGAIAVPNVVCQGTSIDVVPLPVGTGGLGGGITADYFQYQLPSSGTWQAYTTSFTASTVGTISFQSFRSGGLGCASDTLTATTTVVSQPTAPVITTSYTKLCGNASININVSAGTGGGGLAVSKFSISNNVFTDSVITGSINNISVPFPTVSNPTDFIISASRTSSIQGCVSPANAISQTITVYPSLVAGSILTPQTSTSMCGGADSLQAIFLAGSGGFSALDSFYYSGLVNTTNTGYNGPDTNLVAVPTVATNNNFTIHTIRKDTTYGCATNTTSRVISVLPQPAQGTIVFNDASLTNASEVCSGLQVIGKFSGFASSGAQVNYRLEGPNSQLLSFADSNFIFNTSTYLDSTITLVGSSTGTVFGCNSTGNSTATFLVVAQPAISSLLFDTSNVGVYNAVCEGFAIEGNFTGISGGGTNALDSFIASSPATFNSNDFRFSIPTSGLAGGTINFSLQRTSSSPGCNAVNVDTSIAVVELPVSLPLLQIAPNDTSVHTVCQGFEWEIGTSGTLSPGVGTTTNQLYYQIGSNISPLSGPIIFNDTVTSVNFLSAVVSDGPGCMASAPKSRQVSIAIDPAITLNNDTTCKNTSTILEASASGGIGPFSYQWQVYENNTWVANDTTTAGLGNVPVFFTQTLLNSRQTRVILLDQAANLGCDVAIDTAELVLLEQPALPQFAGLDTLCLGTQGVSYGLLGAVPAGIVYYWSTTPAIDGNYLATPNAIFNFPAAPGPVQVRLEVENADGCVNYYEKTVLVTPNAAPETAIINLQQPGNTLICLDNSSDSYLWGFDDALNANRPDTLEGETAQQYFAATDFDTTNRAYWVITSKNGCVTKSYFNQILTSANGHLLEPNYVKCWPNPTDGLLHISSSNTPIQQIACYDIAGRQIAHYQPYSGNNATIDISGFPEGAYYIVVTIEGEVKPYRIIKTNVR